MFDKELKELEYISQSVGKWIDLVQGGGGNTSVKLDGELMAVKASGFKLSQITPQAGYVVVNYSNIKQYYESVDLQAGVDFEKESVEIAKKNVVEMEGLKVLRPSVEAGFHSILKKYVIHTHPVYANILCCAKNGEELMAQIFKGKEYACIWIPYINPGFHLTLAMKKKVEECLKSSGKFPKVIFMENHGLVVTSDDCEDCVSLHEEVNRQIREHFGIREKYPEIVLEKAGEEVYNSKTAFLQEFFKGKELDRDYFYETALYPDQLVYLNENVCVNGTANKLNIDTETGNILYKANYNEALTMEETLLGYVYVIRMIGKLGLPLKTMNEKEVSFIANWESEKYRKSLLKEKKD